MENKCPFSSKCFNDCEWFCGADITYDCEYWKENSEKINDEGINNYNKKYYYNDVEER